jgi:hypothetical protein
MDARVVDHKKANLAAHLLMSKEERKLSKNDASTSSPII